MGSFAASVDLPEPLRPFALAGLELLFLPEGFVGVTETPVTQPADTAMPQPHPHNQMQNQPEAPFMEALPQPWNTLAGRVRTPPRVIITYASLADDLTGTADPGRRKLFQAVLGYLAWPQGTTLFWPISFPQGVQPGPLFASDIFAAGVRHYGALHVLCFGDKSADRAATLFPQVDKSPPFVHRLPDTDTLCALLPHELHQALAALKAITLT